MNYHKKALQIIQQAQSVKELFKLLMEIAIKRPSEIIEAWDRLHPKAKPEVPESMRSKTPFPRAPLIMPKQHICPHCTIPSEHIGLRRYCQECDPDGFAAGRLNTEVAR